jgi:uncharacterized protein YggT (Ycf19 family)
MSLAVDILQYLIGAYILIVLVRVIIDWIPPIDSAVLRKLTLYSHILTEPLLAPLRRVIPMVPMGESMSLDLSPFILTLLLIVLQRLLSRII